MLPPKQPYRSTSVVRAGTGRRERRGQATGTTADHEHVGLVDHVDLACRFGDLCSAFQSIGFTSGTTTSQATRPHRATTPDTIDAEV